jgi:hypothetical protein
VATSTLSRSAGGTTFGVHATSSNANDALAIRNYREVFHGCRNRL